MLAAVKDAQVRAGFAGDAARHPLTASARGGFGEVGRDEEQQTAGANKER